MSKFGKVIDSRKQGFVDYPPIYWVTKASKYGTYTCSVSPCSEDIDNTNVFVFGDKMTGKRSLFRIMNRNLISDNDDENRRLLQIEEEASRFSLLDYTYINIKKTLEEDSEVIGKLSVWIMNDLIDKAKILTFLTPENIVNSICLIMVDLSRPWLVKQSLIKWVELVKEIFGDLISKLPEDKQNEMKENGKK